jgi:hypothetical protein
MDWFEQLLGFREGARDDTRSRLKVAGGRLVSLVNGESYGIGELTLPSLSELRGKAPAGRAKLGIVRGDARSLHRKAEFRGALFQVASQFNLLEMIGPDVTPDDGVTRYASDPTQGPACAIAAGAATIYRNYFAPVGDGEGQTARRQIDALTDIGAALAAALGRPVSHLWEMRNGYAMCRRDGLEAIDGCLATLDLVARDALLAKLRIGLHSDVEVTDGTSAPRPVVSQAFCSALPVAYGRSTPASLWEPFARLILDAAYEATLWAGARNLGRGVSDLVLLTLVGGGAFGNREAWILDAIRRALRIVGGLDVRIVCHGAPTPGVQALVEEFPA